MDAGVYHVPRLTSSCTVRLCIITRKVHVNQQKILVPDCVHTECVFLLVGTAHASIKFKLSCTIPHMGLLLNS